MGIYKLNASELADLINEALKNAEGDFELSELKKSFNIVLREQEDAVGGVPVAEEVK